MSNPTPGTWSYWVERAQGRAQGELSMTCKTRSNTTSSASTRSDQTKLGLARSETAICAVKTSSSATRNSSIVRSTLLLLLAVATLSSLGCAQAAQMAGAELIDEDRDTTTLDSDAWSRPLTPDVELADAVAEAAALWNGAGVDARFVVSDDGLPIRIRDEVIGNDGDPIPAGARFHRSNTSVPYDILISRGWEYGWLGTAMHELCHVLVGYDAGHFDGPGICGEQSWDAEDRIWPEDIAWVLSHRNHLGVLIDDDNSARAGAARAVGAVGD